MIDSAFGLSERIAVSIEVRAGRLPLVRLCEFEENVHKFGGGGLLQLQPIHG